MTTSHMTTSQSNAKSFMLETRYVWGETIADAMSLAQGMEVLGWKIQGNPAPMFWNGRYGTGVSVTRINDG